MIIRELATVQSYDPAITLRKNMRNARRQSKFLVCQALSEAEKVYDRISCA